MYYKFPQSLIALGYKFNKPLYLEKWTFYKSVIIVKHGIGKEEVLVQGKIVFCSSFISICVISGTNHKFPLKLALTKENLPHVIETPEIGQNLDLVDAMVQWFHQWPISFFFLKFAITVLVHPKACLVHEVTASSN